MISQRVVDSLSNRISHLVVSWVLLVPIVYFIAGFWPQHAASNNAQFAGAGSFAAESFTGEQIVTVAVVFSVMLLPVLSKIKSILHLGRKDKVFSTLAILAIASSVWSQFPSRTLEWSLCLAVNTLFAFYLSYRFNLAQQMHLMLLAGWICLFLSVLFALFLPCYGIEQAGGAWQGIYGGKNACSMMTIFLVSAAFYVPTTTMFAKLFRVIYVTLSTFVILMTQSATGKIMLIFLFIFVVGVKLIRKFGLRDKRAAIALSVVIGLPLVVFGISGWRQATYLLGKDPTLTGRTKIWSMVVASSLKHPILGYGYQGFFRGLQGQGADLALKMGSVVSASHNGFLDVMIDLGAVGLIILLYSFFRVFRDAYVCLFANRCAAFGWYICIVALVVVANLDERAMMVPNNLIWILYIIACIGLADKAKTIRFGIVQKDEHDPINFRGIHCAE